MSRNLSSRRFAVVFALGFFALIAQTILFRTFFSVYEGNELGLACFFSSWLMWVSLGGLTASLPAIRRTKVVEAFEFLPLLYIPAFLLQARVIALSRVLAGVTSYELFPFVRMLPVSFVANAPVSFLTGLLFSLACQWLSESGGIPVARVYIIEAVGACVGGILVTLALALGMPTETIFLYAAIVVSAATLGCSIDFRQRCWASLPLLGLVAILLLGGDRALTRANEMRAWGRLLPSETYEGSFTTPQAKYLYGSYMGQVNVVAWQSVVDSIPDAESASEVVAIHLSQNPRAKTVLVVGPGGYSVCRRLLEIPQVERVSWMDTDPDYPSRLLDVLPETLRSADKRLVVRNSDVREYLAADDHLYDLVILHLPPSTTLSLNRYSTSEFFELVSSRLTSSGVLGVRVQGGENFMGDELVNVGASAYYTLKDTFVNVAVKPGATTWLLGSNGDGLLEVPGFLRDRFASIEGAKDNYPPDGLLSLYPADRIEYQRTQYEQSAASVSRDLLINSDKNPKALLHALLYVAKEMGGSESTTDFIYFFATYGLWVSLLLLVGYLLFRRLYVVKSGGSDTQGLQTFDIYFLVASTGAVGMALSIVLMFVYQSAYGSIFLHIGLVSAVFMAGLAAGSISTERVLIRWPGIWGKVLIAGSLVHVGLTVAIALLPPVPTRTVLVFLFGATGLLGGLYVPLAAAALRTRGQEDRYAGAMIELNDHLGGAVGGLAAGLLFLPVLGGQLSLAVIAALVLVNPVSLLLSRKSALSQSSEPFDYHVRVVGYMAVGIALFLLLVAGGFRAKRVLSLDALLGSAAHTMAESVLTEELHVTERGDAVRVYVENDETGAVSSRCFHTGDLVRDVAGYAGPIVCAVKCARDGMLNDFAVIKSRETPAYMDRLLEWRKQLLGKNIFLEDPFEGVDAYTGATLTSDAIMRTLNAAGSEFASQILASETTGEEGGLHSFSIPDVRVVTLILFAGLALYLRRNPSRTVRRYMLLTVVGISGFYLNMQYSSAQVFSLLTFRWPSPGMNVAFWMILLIPVLVLLVGNIYCGYLCPFGALQELLGDLLPAKWQIAPDKEVWKYARKTKFVLLLLLVCLFVSSLDYGILEMDPLVTVFGNKPEGPILLLAVAVLILSIVYPRFWCRNLCPTGAFLSLLNGPQLLKKVVPPVAPKLCGYAVRNKEELDCLCCDRCRRVNQDELRRFRTPQKEETRRTANLVFITAVVIVAAFILHGMTGAAYRGASDRALSRATGAGEPRNVDMPRLMEMIEKNELSDHEAMHYERVR